MKLGRTCAAAAVLAVTTLPLTAAISWADEPPTTPAPAEATEQPTAKAPAPAEPTEQPRATQAPAEDRAQPGPQVFERPVGAPDTGGDPDDSGIAGLTGAVGGAAAAVAVAGGGAVLMVRRRRAGAN